MLRKVESSRIRSALVLIAAIMAATCSGQQQPANTSAVAQDAAPAPRETPLDERFEGAFKRILVLPPDAFPALPHAIVSMLRTRGCMIPQPGASGPPRNVIHGKFFDPSETGWAVLCSSNGSSSIVVFHNDRDDHPEELGTRRQKLFARCWS